MAAAAGGPKPPCGGVALAPAAAAVGVPAATAAAAAITSEPLELSAAAEAAGAFVGSAPPGIAVATGLNAIGAVAACCAAVPVSVADASSAAVLSLDLSVDLPSPAFEVADLEPPCFEAPVLAPESAVSVLPDGPLLAGGSSRPGGVGSAAAVVSRDDLSSAVSLAGRCEGGRSGVGAGVLEGSGAVLLSTSAAKLSLACDGSRPAGFAGALE